MIRDFEGKLPRIDPSAFVAESADLIGDIVIGAQSSILYQAVLRADNNRIEIGERSNVQDAMVIHCDPDLGDRWRPRCNHRCHGLTGRGRASRRRPISCGSGVQPLSNDRGPSETRRPCERFSGER